MAYCERCGYEYRKALPACPDCGQLLVAGPPVRCPACGEEIPDGEASCPHCGVLLPEGEVAAPACEAHPGVPAVARCVLCDEPLCPDCVERRAGKAFCARHADEKTAFDWVSVFSASSPIEAELVRASLLAAGIPATVLGQTDSMYVVTVGDLAVAEVMVPKGVAEDARRLLVELRNTPADAGGDPDNEASP